MNADEKTISLQQDQSYLALIEKIDAIKTELSEVRSLIGPFGVPLPDGRMLVQTLYGIKYLIDPNDLVMAPQLIVYRQWEPDLSRYFSYNAHKDTVFVDVGANFGYFTCLVGSKIGVNGLGKVYAFEPNPKLYSLLENNKFINWSMCPIEAYKIAVGAAEQLVQLHIPLNRAANATLSASTFANTNQIDVMMRRLDDVIPHNQTVDLMKIDVEGHEYGVLKGAANVIARSPNLRIVIEWSLEQMVDAGCSAEQMLDLFAEQQLVAFELPSDGQKLVKKFDSAELSSTPYGNIVLAKA